MTKYASMSFIAIGASLISACVPALQGSEQTLGSAITASKVPLTASLSLAERINFEQRLSQDSIAFLSSKRTVSEDFKCSTNADREIIIAKNRLLTFKAIEAHFKQIQDELNNNFDAKKAVDEIKEIQAAWESVPFAPRAFSNHLKLIEGVLDAAQKAVNNAQRQDDYARKIPKLAIEFSKNLESVSKDLKASLTKSKSELGAYITAWKTCEYERLMVIYSNDNANPVEIAALFETYKTKAENYEKENNIIIGDDKIFDKMIEANKILFEPKLNWDYAKKLVGEITDRLKEYQAVDDEIKKLWCARKSIATPQCS